MTLSREINQIIPINQKDLAKALAQIAQSYDVDHELVAPINSLAAQSVSANYYKGPLVSLNAYWFGVQLVIPEEIMDEAIKAVEIGGGAAGVSAAIMGGFSAAIQAGAISVAASGPAAPIAAAIFACVAAWFVAQGVAAKTFDKGNGCCWTFAWPTLIAGPLSLLTILPIPCTPVQFNHKAMDGSDTHQDTAIAFLSHEGTAYSVTMAGNTFTNTFTQERRGLLDYVDSNGAKKFLRVDGKQFLVADNPEMQNATGVWDIDYMVGTSGLKYTANIAW
jgi:hypothetical protein